MSSFATFKSEKIKSKTKFIRQKVNQLVIKFQYHGKRMSELSVQNRHKLLVKYIKAEK